MKDEIIRKAYDNYGKENDMEIIFLENPSFDNSIVGISSTGKLIYDYELMVQEMADEDHIDILEAQEFIDYNTMRALPYFGSDAPIVINQKTADIIQSYGED